MLLALTFYNNRYNFEYHMCGGHILFVQCVQDIGMPLFLRLREHKCHAEGHIVNDFLD